MRVIANIFSFVFHPLLALTYILLLIILVDPFVFGSYNVGGSLGILAMTFASTFFFPGLAIFMMYKLDLVKDMKMPGHKDRIIPLLISMVCYFSVFAFLYKQVESPVIFQSAALGACIAMSLTFLITIFYKISLHAIGMGSILAIMIVLSLLYKNVRIIFNLGALGHYTVPIIVLLFIVILITGIVLSSRLYLKAHTPAQVYSGLILGTLVQFIALMFFKSSL